MQFGQPKRREVITLLGGAAAWPLAVRAQPMPVIGYFGARTSASDKHLVDAFRNGLEESAIGVVPMVFAIGGDPVEYGFVASFNRPGGNATGVTVITALLWPKRLELLRELAPGTTATALIVDPTHPSAACRDSEGSADGRTRWRPENRDPER